MTGTKGTRGNREVALVTQDFQLYHRLAPMFERQGITILGLQPENNVPASVRVLINGPEDNPLSIPILGSDEATMLSVLQRLDDRPTAAGEYRRVIFGVDPGQTIGLAVVADDRVLMVATRLEPEAAVKKLMAWQSGLKSSSISIQIGDGAPKIGRAIEQELLRLCPDTPRRFVSETSTSPRAPVTGSRHTDAAALIALRRR